MCAAGLLAISSSRCSLKKYPPAAGMAWHGMAVGHCSLCSGHALVQRCAFMVHQRQQPLQRVGCLGQAMYQAGLVAAACGSSCALPAPSPSVCRLDCFRHGAFSARAEQCGVQRLAPPDFGATPPAMAHTAHQNGPQRQRSTWGASPLSAASPLWGSLGSDAKVFSPVLQARTRVKGISA